MSSGTVMVFGAFSSVLLVISCISLNAAEYYSELTMNESSQLLKKPTIVLRDRTHQSLLKEVK